MTQTRLYLISPPQIELKSFARQLENAFTGGDVGSFQLRLKNVSDDDVIAACRELMPICHAHDAAFIVNDNPGIASRVRADGVHLGQDDGAVKTARAIVGENAIIGVSCHDSRHLAMEAGEQGADYVAFGAFYPTKSKSAEALAKYGTPKPEIVGWWSEMTVLPCVAIGGMTPENCVPLVKAGADFIAVITAVWEHPESPAAAVKAFNSEISRAGATNATKAHQNLA